MSKVFVIHITPQLPPAICGVTDYAVLVGRKMEALNPDVKCGYLACGHQAAGRAVVDAGQASFDAPAADIRGACRADAFWNGVASVADELRSRWGQAADEVRLVLQYSGYGYDRSGAPAWLVEALAARPARFRDVRLVTMFHELYATGKPWQRSFWSSGRQRRAAMQLARASGGLMTNREASARWLETAAGRRAGSVPHLATPSNVGEPEQIVPWEERLPRAVLFGGASFKAPFFKDEAARLTVDLCRKLGINEIVDIGQPMTPGETSQVASAGIEFISTGYLRASSIGPYLATARIVFLEYYPGYEAKSGVLAAAAAHGTPAIYARRRATDCDGLQDGINVWALPAGANAGAEILQARMSQLSQNIRTWYQDHTLADHARTLLHAGNPKRTCVA